MTTAAHGPAVPGYTVTALKLGSIRIEQSVLTDDAGHGVVIDAPVWVAAVEGDGLRMLVDTGIRDPSRWVPYHPCWQEPDETLPTALAHIGWDVDDVDVVVNSHLHYDHAENNVLLPRAQFYVSRAEWEYAQTPIADQGWLYDYPWSEPDIPVSRYTLLDGDHEIRPGIRVIQTPGHSGGHQAVLVHTVSGVVCITGDAAAMLENFTLPTPPGGHTSREQALASLERIRASSDMLLMSHDPSLAKYQNTDFPRTPPRP